MLHELIGCAGKLHKAKNVKPGLSDVETTQTITITYSVRMKVKEMCPWLNPFVKREMTEFEGETTQETRRTNREVEWSSYKRQRNNHCGLIKKS